MLYWRGPKYIFELPTHRGDEIRAPAARAEEAVTPSRLLGGLVYSHRCFFGYLSRDGSRRRTMRTRWSPSANYRPPPVPVEAADIRGSHRELTPITLMKRPLRLVRLEQLS
jgi:hypothetical protein